MTFSTGFQSNLGIISAIVGKNDFVICDKENHASIYDGCRLSYGTMLRFKHADMDSLENALKKVPQGAGALIVTDGVFSMSGDIAKLPEIVELKEKYGAALWSTTPTASELWERAEEEPPPISVLKARSI